MTNQEFLESITLDGEEWRGIVGYDGRYVVSNFGRIASFEYPHEFLNHGRLSTRIYPPKLITPTRVRPPRTKDYGCYLTVKLGPKKNRELQMVHRLVADAFIPNPNNYPHIDHIDGNKENNNAANLKWCTPRMNMNNPITKNRIRTSNIGNTKIAKNCRIAVVSLKDNTIVKAYPSIMSTREDGYSPMSVRACCLGIRDSHKGTRWQFLSDYEASNQ